jgi:hypothetical protein
MKLRISVQDLPARQGKRTDEEIDRTLSRLGAEAGSVCELNCDCKIGLLCLNGICTAKEP